MIKIHCDYIAFSGAEPSVYARGKELLNKYLPGFLIEDTKSDPEILFILTGGSEDRAKSIVDRKQFMLILALNENNSYAAATEIKAYCTQKNIKTILINLDTDKNAGILINNYIQSIRAIEKIKNYNVGLVGTVSNWLIASDIQSDTLEQKLEIKLKKIDWIDSKKYFEYNINNDFIEHFNFSENIDLTDSSKVYSLLINIINTHKLDAITVECFPLVRESAVTACLGLSKLNTDFFPAGCEGDLTSIVGMIITKELVGIIPWMANLVSINNKTTLFAHCTIPTNFVSEYSVTTHFETNLGTAIKGKFKTKDVTIFRFNNKLEQVYITKGTVINLPNKNDACRTQVEIEIPESELNILKNNPLGNHHLIVPGNYVEILKTFCFLKNISINQSI